MVTRRQFAGGLAAATAGGAVLAARGIAPSERRGDGEAGGNETATRTRATPTAAPPEGLRSAVRSRVDKLRHDEHGGLVPDLKPSPRLRQMAEFHSGQMAQAGRVGSAVGMGLVERYQKFGAWRMASEGVRARIEEGDENVCTVPLGSRGADELAAEITKRWDGSVMLDKTWVRSGVGLAPGGDGMVYATQNFL